MLNACSGRKEQWIKILTRTLVIAILLQIFFHGAGARAAIVRSFTDTMSGQKVNNGSNHTIKFTSPTGVNASSDTIVISFETGFTVSGLDFGDVDLSHGPTTGAETEETLAAAAAAGTWGASFSGQALTLTAPTDAGGSEIAASDVVIIEIGGNATAGATGDTQVANPSSAGNYRVFVGGAFGDEGSVGVPIIANDQVAVSATVASGQSEGGGGGPPPPPPPPPPSDVTPPAISNILVDDIRETSVKITWTTNEAATSIVEYGKTVAYGSSAGDGATLVFNHTVVLGGLTQGTLYHFRVKSADGSGNLATSGDGTFTTLAGIDVTEPVISDITVTDITGSRATVNWTTDEPADSVVEYGETAAYGTAVNDPTLVINHSVILIGLTPDTLYHFRVRSTDASGNEGFSNDATFRTADIAPPVISNIQVVDITETSARVIWDTDESATSRVEYGLTNAYGSAVANASLVQSHSLLLGGLQGGTTYHFRVRSADAAGNEASSSDRTFITAPDVTPPPNVNNFRVTATTDVTMNLAWDPPANPDYAGVRIQMSSTDFPGAVGEGTNVYDGSGTSVVVGGLTPGTTYYFTAFAYDHSRNYASGAITFGTTLVAPPPPVPPPEQPPQIPPEEVPPAPPPIPLPPVTVPPVERISMSDAHFFVAGRTLEVFPRAGVVTALPNLMMTVTISRDAFVRTPRRVILNVGGSSYLMEENLGKNAFEVGFALPPEVGDLAAAIIVQYGDASEDALEFSFRIASHGTVFEMRNGVRIPVDGAEVTLYEIDGGKNEWEAGRFSQVNPIVTSASGAYAFLVPAGSYQLVARKNGYKSGETSVFEMNDVFINRDIEIFRIPPPLREVIKPGAPLIKNIAAVIGNLTEKAVFNAKVARQEIVKVIDNPTVEKVNEIIAAPAIVSVAVANTAAATGLLQLLNYLRFLLTQPIVLLQRKKRKGWGIVYHSLTKLPIDLAIIRLMNASTNRPIATRVTDKEGRYAFIADTGLYRLEVTKPGFVFPTQLLKFEKEDAGLVDLYHGEEIAVRDQGATIAANIPLDPLEHTEKPRRIIVRKYLKILNNLVSVLGIVLSIISFVITPSLLFAAFLFAQILLYAALRRVAVTKPPKSWGIVYDEKTRRPLRFAVARIFDTKYNKLLETQVTDVRGRYNFLVGRSKYYVTYEKGGYEKKQTEEIDLSGSAKPEVVAKDVGLKPERKT